MRFSCGSVYLPCCPEAMFSPSLGGGLGHAPFEGPQSPPTHAEHVSPCQWSQVGLRHLWRDESCSERVYYMDCLSGVVAPGNIESQSFFKSD